MFQHKGKLNRYRFTPPEVQVHVHALSVGCIGELHPPTLHDHASTRILARYGPRLPSGVVSIPNHWLGTVMGHSRPCPLFCIQLNKICDHCLETSQTVAHNIHVSYRITVETCSVILTHCSVKHIVHSPYNGIEGIYKLLC